MDLPGTIGASERMAFELPASEQATIASPLTLPNPSLSLTLLSFTVGGL